MTPDTKKSLAESRSDAAEVAPAVETKTAGIDWAEINARMAQQRAEARERLKVESIKKLGG